MGASALDASLVRQYSTDAGIALRTAQLHRRSADPRWSTWLRNRSAPTSAVATDAPAAPGDSALGRAQQRARTAKDAFDGAALLLREALKDKDHVTLPGYTKAAQIAGAFSHQADTHLRQAEVAARSVVPIAELHEFDRGFLQPLGDLLDHMPRELAGKFGFDHDHALAVLTDWVENRARPALSKAGAELATLT
jgi:hypothetical protein